MVENSDEIKKLFYQDSFHKKKIGSNVHRMTGKGKRGGIKGGIVFAKNNFKKYEKNSRVRIDNLFENILPFNEFVTYGEDIQREMLIEWLTRYSREKVKTNMRIGYKRLEGLIKKFDIELERSRMKAKDSEMREFKSHSIEVARFKLLPDSQKYEIVDHWQQERGLLNKDIAKKLGYNENTFNTKKSLWKKEYEKRKDANNMSDYNDDFLLQSADIPKDNPAQMDGRVNIKEQKPIYNKEQEKAKKDYAIHDQYQGEDSLFKIEFKGRYTVDNLDEKYEAIRSLLDDNKVYEIAYVIKEINK